VILGGVAAVGVPWAFDGERTLLARWVDAGTVDLPFAGLEFSWPLFCAVTGFAWLLLRAARSG
jgi:hypothetical protein